MVTSKKNSAAIEAATNYKGGELGPAIRLTEHIKAQYNGKQSEFATAQGVDRPQVTQWINKGFIVVSGVLYSPRRELKGPTND